MYCGDVKQCLDEMGEYSRRGEAGYPLIVNTDNYDDFQEIRNRLEADGARQCVYVSEYTLANGLPDIESAKRIAAGSGRFALIGVSQAAMLRGARFLDELLDELIGYPVSGNVIILLSHCRIYLEKFLKRDIRLKNRIVLVEGEKTPLPQIKIADSAESCEGIPYDDGISALIRRLERVRDAEVAERGFFTVATSFSAEFFLSSLYAVSKSGGVYDVLAGRYPVICGAAPREYGTDAQWRWLYRELEGRGSFQEFAQARFGSASNLESALGGVMNGVDENEKWLLWLSLKIFGAKGGSYLSLAVTNSASSGDLEDHIYMDLLDVERGNPDFERYYAERRRLIAMFPENLEKAGVYCQNVGRHGRDAAYYLTDATEQEEYALMQSIGQYEWTDGELLDVFSHGFPELSQYMREFVFDESNTRLPEKDRGFRETLTDYFQRYKMQKIRNRIDADFLEEVERFAEERPFLKLQSRSSIISSMDREGAQGYFFDALGVEYLAYIQAKCEKYGMICEIQAAHCELPSITVMNKDFKNYFDTKDIGELDTLKHHSPIYDYRTCQYPIHIFRELRIIDGELKKMRAWLGQSGMKKAVVVSDHGASRLAVIYRHESGSGLELEEKGVHSGRCCPAAEDPGLPFAAYENGYSVLGNYERFKGSRMANLEAHGGASLEEALVPIITLSLRPAKAEYRFVQSALQYKVGRPVQIELFCNVPMERPRLLVNGVFYDGALRADGRHAVFSMDGVKQKGEYAARVYEGEANTGVELAFTLERKTRDRNQLGI